MGGEMSKLVVLLLFVPMFAAATWAQESTFPEKNEVKQTEAIRQSFKEQALDAVDLLDESSKGVRAATEEGSLAVKKLRRSVTTSGEWDLGFAVSGYQFTMQLCRLQHQDECAGLYDFRDKAVRLAKSAPVLEDAAKKSSPPTH